MKKNSITHKSNLVLDYHISHNFELRDYRTVNINQLHVGLINHEKSKIEYMGIKDTPHFIFVRNVLYGDPIYAINGYQDYKDYISVNNLSFTIETFIKLIYSIKENGYDSNNRPILVFRHWSRMLPLCRWDVADGFHRLAILAAMDVKTVKVATLQNNKSIFKRFVNSMLV